MTRLNLRRLVMENTGVQMATTAVALGLGCVTTAVLSRYLGVERFGKFNYLFAFFSFFLSLNDFGVNVIVIREVSQAREQAGKIIGAILYFKVLLALFSMLGAWIVIGFMDFPVELRHSLWIFALVLPMIALQLPSVIYPVTLQLGRLATLTLLTKGLIGFLLLMSAVGLGYGLGAFATACVLAEGAFMLVVFVDARRFVQPVLRCDLSYWKQILRPSLTLGVTSLCVAVINQADFILLERMTDMRQVGLYAAATKVITFLEAFPLLVMGTLYPLMSRYAKENPQGLRSLYKHSVLGLGAIAICMGLIVTLAAPLMIRLLFDIQFRGAEQALVVLIWATVFLYVAIIGGNLLISLGQEKVNLALNLLGAGLSVGLNLWLIPTMGFVGSAWAMAVTYLFLLVGTGIMTHRALGLLTPALIR